MYVYIRSEPQLFTVGFYTPKGEWVPDSDHDSKEEAAKRVHYLNGGNDKVEALEKQLRAHEENTLVHNW